MPGCFSKDSHPKPWAWMEPCPPSPSAHHVTLPCPFPGPQGKASVPQRAFQPRSPPCLCLPGFEDFAAFAQTCQLVLVAQAWRFFLSQSYHLSSQSFMILFLQAALLDLPPRASCLPGFQLWLLVSVSPTDLMAL